jgi:hypothetical protein
MSWTGVRSRLVKALVHVLMVFISVCRYDILARNRSENLVNRGEIFFCFIVAVDNVEVLACDPYDTLNLRMVRLCYEERLIDFPSSSLSDFKIDSNFIVNIP